MIRYCHSWKRSLHIIPVFSFGCYDTGWTTSVRKTLHGSIKTVVRDEGTGIYIGWLWFILFIGVKGIHTIWKRKI